jgi:hypothetical protein
VGKNKNQKQPKKVFFSKLLGAFLPPADVSGVRPSWQRKQGWKRAARNMRKGFG